MVVLAEIEECLLLYPTCCQCLGVVDQYKLNVYVDSGIRHPWLCLCSLSLLANSASVPELRTKSSTSGKLVCGATYYFLAKVNRSPS